MRCDSADFAFQQSTTRVKSQQNRSVKVTSGLADLLDSFDQKGTRIWPQRKEYEAVSYSGKLAAGHKYSAYSSAISRNARPICASWSELGEELACEYL